MIVVSHNNSATTTTTRLLLVDNEPDNTSVLSMGLEDEDFKVDAFTDQYWHSLILSQITILW